GLYKRGHFFLESSITSRGDITIENWNNAPIGTIEKLQLVTSTDLVSATITAITGVVDPKITINDTQFTINDIPDFLSDDENSLDVANPRFYVTVTNNSPVEIELNAQLASFSNDIPGSAFATANIGAAYGTAPVIIGANGTTEILISQEAVTGMSGTNIVVPGLSELIKTIPDFMRFQNVDCHAVQKEFTIALAPTYDFTTDYEAVIPLSFGADMRLHYTHEDTEWDTEDLDKFSFSKVRLSFNAVNTIPLTMTPDVIALDRQGNEISDIKASVSGQVAAGSINAPSTSSVEVILTSTASNLSQVDGIRFVFDAVSDPSHVGYNLNSAQSLRFTDIKAEIIGGLTIDLN
ncbi:MAG: hypothetical protein K2F79_03680, partial [Muribaculaceae bacterium]|nr:hypothetical protein [Muribaculaceae bacterium]